MRSLLNSDGCFGAVLPSGIATDDTTKLFFQHVVETGALVSVLDIENTYGFFPQVDRNTKFCLFTSGADAPASTRFAEFVCGIKDIAEIRDPEKRYSLTSADILLFNPNTRTCPLFRCRRDALLTKKIYKGTPTLMRDGAPSDNKWGITFYRMFDMANDSQLFCSADSVAGHSQSGRPAFLRVYEGKMFHQFNHRFASALEAESGQKLRGASKDSSLEELENPEFTPTGRYWVPEGELPEWAASHGLRHSRPFWPSAVLGVLSRTFARWCLQLCPCPDAVTASSS